MKIAIPTRNNVVDGHFGHCEFYTIYTIDNNKNITNKEIMESPQGCGCKSNIAGVLKQDGVSIMLAGNMGEGAFQMLNRFGIDVVRGCNGDTDKLVKEYLEDKIIDNGVLCAHHHNHDHDHNHEGHQCNH
ncbi:MAG: dinitrogenase iron-molybdenum cofactor biosynthesis protein [Bacteroidetes bacterium GWC2_33_15]|nr:MAG: dinitrogenase iron-molybdenum cofactor biosynthesis protein [Bacteroidetes bacterium GWA2_33_15]OFX52238.1 MAG: dinitrogenase iron-molybdenum cofactor biosynthesis protein [Bacteroidetes bacterium GWC2_33_15]OFX64392.1 MAG: dinitrogenase iron-molybdenum cofactor biosynthesis protein [Bacteroidetes bacterium GWB2_32_14]OFX67797.1 MAG: dinitrogenase iron-molybdenum cofactor biosynthesis protein [Bacteroidetes bacterium GWD2_33_33]HAN19409.1 dinitrogenase iron-molybdenum cofactor biosynthe